MSERSLFKLLDPRVALGLGVTALALWFAFRDVDLESIGRDIAGAHLGWLLLPSVPAYVLSLWVRAARWRHLAAGLATFERRDAYRATAVGFMVNNILPLRVGEVVRPWFLARECGAPGAALLGTILVERVFDALAILAMASILLGTTGARAAGLEPSQVLPILGAVAFVPIFGIAALRVAPDFWLGINRRVLEALLPHAIAERICAFVAEFARGLGALSDPRALFWTVFHTFVLWGCVSWVPFAAAAIALGVDLNGSEAGVGGPGAIVQAGFMLLTFVAAAVAIPSAPGFIGPYHAACRLALVPLGVPKELALALGTLAHAVFWLSHVAMGLLALRGRGGLQGALQTAPDPDPAAGG